MRKIIFMAMLIISVIAFGQNVSRKGNTFSMGKTIRDTLVTQFKYEDRAGKSYPIVVNKKTGACWVCKISKNGKFYRQYMNTEIKSAVCKELNITIKK